MLFRSLVNENVLAFLKNIARDIYEKPFFISVTTQPGYPPVEKLISSLSGNIELVKLTGLNKKHITSLVRQLFGSDFSDEFIEWLYRNTMGNPLFIREMLRAMVDRNIIQWDMENSIWVVQPFFKDIRIPLSIESIIQQRLQALTSEEMDFLKYASVLGETFSLPLLSSLTSLDQIELKSCLQGPMRRGIINVEGHLLYRFSHTIVRKAIYEGMKPAEREKIHKKVTEILMHQMNSGEKVNIGNIVAHLRKGYKKAQMDDRVVKLVLDTGNTKWDEYNYKEALECYSWAVKIIENNNTISSELKANIYLKYGEVQYMIGDYRKVRFGFREVLKIVKKEPLLVGGIRQVVQIYRMLGESLAAIGEMDKGLKSLDDGMSLLESTGRIDASDKDYISLYIARASILLYKEDFNGAEQYCQKVVDYLPHNLETSASKRCLSYLGYIKMRRGQYADALKYYKKLKEYAIANGDNLLLCGCMGDMGSVYKELGDFEKALPCSLQLLNTTQKYGLLGDEAVGWFNLAGLYSDWGLLEKAKEAIHKALAINKRLGETQELPFMYHTLSLILQEEEEWDELLKVSERGEKIARRCGTLEVIPGMCLLQGWAYAGKGEREKSLRCAQRAMEEISKAQIKSELPFIYELLGWLSAEEGDIDKTREYFEKSCAILENKDLGDKAKVLMSYGFALHKLSILPGGAEKREWTEEVEGKLKSAGDIFSNLGMDYYLQKLLTHIKRHNINYLNPLKRAISNRIKNGRKITIAPTNGLSEKLRLYTFKSFRVFRPGEETPIPINEWDSAKARELVALLIAAKISGGSIHREKFMDTLYPGLSADQILDNFHVTLSRARKALGREHYIIYKSKYYFLTDDKVWIDVQEFQRLVNEGKKFENEGKMHTTIDRYSRAVGLYKGDFLEEFYEPWTDSIRGELGYEYTSALTRLATISIRTLDYEGAVDWARKLLSYNPTDEIGHRLLMTAFSLKGDKSAAIKQYEKCKQILKGELEVEPSEEVNELYNRIKKGLSVVIA